MDWKYLVRGGLGIPDYWHPRLTLHPEALSSSHVGCYPIAMESKADYPGEIDDAGIPIVVLNGRRMTIPITIVLYGLGSYDAFAKSQEARYSLQLARTLEWLSGNSVTLGDGIGWPHLYEYESYGLKSPWFSAIVQGLALSLFIRAHELYRERRWYELAVATWRGMRTPMDHGGFCRPFGGGVVYEEYPVAQLDCVFNGMCFALIGLWECARYSVAEEAGTDFDLGARALRTLLPRFDWHGWSVYSLNSSLGKPLLASPYYHRANGILAQLMAVMTGDPEFAEYSARWLRSGGSVGRRVGVSLKVAVDRYRVRGWLERDISR
jgi:hypothetical protein